MPSQVYTVELGTATTAPGTTTLIFSPPPGYRYVITDIYAHSEQAPDPTPLSGFTAFTLSGGTIWTIATFALRQKGYHWTGRQVLDVGDQLDIDTGDALWQFRATGFQLFLP